MRKTNWLHYLLSAFLLLFACKNDRKSLAEANPADTKQTELNNTPMDAPLIAGTVLLNPRNSHWYTYSYQDQTLLTIQTATSDNRSENPTLDSMYEISEKSRLPLFHENCLSATAPEQCSNEAVLDWMQYAVERPAIRAEQRGKLLHYVSFMIDKKGKVDSIKIIPTKEFCEECVAATIEAVAGMHIWIPAVRNGQPVTVQVVLPVYYD